VAPTTTPITTTPITTTPITTTPITTTPQPIATCNSIIAITTTWAEGYSNTLKIPMPNPGSSQAINLTLLSSIPTTSATYKLQIKALPGSCSTGNPTTLSTTPSLMTVPTPTSVPVASCSSVVSTISLWPGSYMAFLNVTVPINVTSWSMQVTFSSPITNLQVRAFNVFI